MKANTLGVYGVFLTVGLLGSAWRVISLWEVHAKIIAGVVTSANDACGVDAECARILIEEAKNDFWIASVLGVTAVLVPAVAAAIIVNLVINLRQRHARGSRVGV